MAATISKDQALSRLNRAQNALARLSKKTNRLIVGLGMSFGIIAMSYGVGRLRGWAAKKQMSLDIPGTPIPIPMAVGVVMAAIGSTDLVSEEAGLVLQSVGTGLVAADAALLGYEHQSGTVIYNVAFGNGGGGGGGGAQAAVGPAAPGVVQGMPAVTMPDIELPPLAA